MDTNGCWLSTEKIHRHNAQTQTKESRYLPLLKQYFTHARATPCVYSIHDYTFSDKVQPFAPAHRGEEALQRKVVVSIKLSRFRLEVRTLQKDMARRAPITSSCAPSPEGSLYITQGQSQQVPLVKLSPITQQPCVLTMTPTHPLFPPRKSSIRFIICNAIADGKTQESSYNGRTQTNRTSCSSWVPRPR